MFVDGSSLLLDCYAVDLIEEGLVFVCSFRRRRLFLFYSKIRRFWVVSARPSCDGIVGDKEGEQTAIVPTLL
ncbi:hypothetical protein VTJ04DRAFT_9759 [Mycothermus thermophilus]|uniref:uncharacterized protein n=1 Tax=Humicola insolens TaxID=85995 RepID=UPI003743ADF7